MARQFVKDLGQQASVNEVFVASNKQLRANRNGDLYLQLELSDRTGTISARMWNAKESLYRSFENGDYVRVQGTTQVYQGALQMIATDVSRASGGDVDAEDFVQMSQQRIDRLSLRLAELLRGMKNPALLNIAECFLADEAFMGKFTKAPAGIKNHHAYHGGLLDHVVTMMEAATRIAEVYPALDPDVLLMGVFLHDMGKIDELSYDKAFAYTDEGQLVGHLVMAVSMLETKVREAEALTGETVPPDLVVRLKHIIVSHHGEYEFGSPKLPMTLEALTIFYLDNIDAKLHAFQRMMEDDPNVAEGWTMYNPNIRRKLFKGSEPSQ